MGAMILISIQLLLLVISPSKTKASAESANISLHGCPDMCSGIPVPYPFGIGHSCAMSRDYELSCNTTDNGTSTLHLLGHETVILNISLSLGQGHISSPISFQCYNSSTKLYDYNIWKGSLRNLPYRFNHEKNKFLVIGCDTLAYLNFSNGQNYYLGGCISRCSGLESLTNGPCFRIGCCQTAIPKGTNSFSVDFDKRFNNSEVYNFSRCGYAVLMDDTAGFTFNTSYISTDELYGQKMSLVVDWFIGNTTCDVAQANKTSYACISKYSVCSDSISGPGYLCNCSDGYQGNPYLEGGCQGLSLSFCLCNKTIL